MDQWIYYITLQKTAKLGDNSYL